MCNSYFIFKWSLKLAINRLSGFCFLYVYLVLDMRVGVRILWLHSGLVLYANGSLGCTNNNYASREKCKKCGQPKEVAAMPAIAIPGGSVPSYAHYFARAQAGSQQKMNIGLINNPSVQYGSQLASNWPLGGNSSSILPYPNQANQLPSAPEGWRSGDWICTCGFHNYSSRAQV